MFLHNHFSAKPCPRTALTSNNMDKWYEMIYFEYEIMKYFSDFEINLISHAPSFLDNNGRISNNLTLNSFVEYTLSITSPDDETLEKRFRTVSR